jgi:hypothetical protein
VRPSPPLCDAVPPTPVRLTRRTLERGRRSPRSGDERLLHARTGLRRDVRPAGPVTYVTIGLVRPSPLSQHHPGHCISISYTVGGRGDKTPPHRLLCAQQPPISRTFEPMYERRPNEKPLRHHPRSGSWTDTGHAMTSYQKRESPGRSSTPRHCTPYHHT